MFMMRMIVIVTVIMILIVIAGLAIEMDVELHALDAHFLLPRRVQVVAVEGHLFQLTLQGAELDAEVQQRAKKHVTADAAEEVEVEGFHGKRCGKSKMGD